MRYAPPPPFLVESVGTKIDNKSADDAPAIHKH